MSVELLYCGGIMIDKRSKMNFYCDKIFLNVKVYMVFVVLQLF